MANRHVFPREIDLFDEYVIRSLAYVTKYQARLNISDDNLNAMIAS